MDRMLLGTGGAKGFPVNRQMRMISMALRGQQATGFLSTAALRFPPLKKGGKQLVQVLSIHLC
jgi:hypothetical protein